MNWSPILHPELWQPLAIVVLTGVLGWYSWRRRRQPGAFPFALGCAFSLIWAVGSAGEKLASEPTTQIAWYVFKAVWLLPTVCAISAFIVQYSGLGRWLTRRTVLSAFVLPSVVIGALTATNGLHHLMALGPVVVDGVVQVGSLGPGGWVSAGYHVLLGVFNVVLLLRVWVISPARRWPVGLVLLGHVIARAAFAYEMSGHWPFLTPDPEVTGVGIPFVLYAIALFGFRVFDPVPQARTTAIEQMRDAMLVLDPEARIVYANQAAESLLGKPLAAIQGRAARAVLPEGVLAEPTSDPASFASFRTGHGAAARDLTVSSTSLTDGVGHPLGRLLLLRDVTDEHRAQAYLLDRERADAALREREHLARELHDSVGQVLGYVSMQAQAADKWVREGDGARATALLTRLTEVAQRAHDDTREAILALKAAPAADWSFLESLHTYAKDFERQYGIATAVTTGATVSSEPFEPGTSVHVLRVIQEAMSNARRHGRAHAIGIHIENQGRTARVTIDDDGRGIPTDVPGPATGHFGISFMRERMAEVGGSMTIVPRPEKGTRVALTVPVHNSEEAA